MEQKTLFIACQLGLDNSEERKNSNLVDRHLIRPVMAKITDVKIEHIRSDWVGKPGRITTQILQHLVKADVVIADLTGLNGNVLYELGIRQALLKPYVLIAKKGTELPFDLRDYRTVFYVLDLDEIENAKDELEKHLRAALNGHTEPLDQQLFGGRPVFDEHNSVDNTDLIINALDDIASTGKDTQAIVDDLKLTIIEDLQYTLQNSIAAQSSGNYVYIEGEKPAFAELIAATLRARDHVRSTRFFSRAITTNQPDYGEAIEQRVLGSPDYPALKHYSRIIQVNNAEKLQDVELYLRKFSGKPFTFYLTPHSNNFELVIIDDSEVFIHFHAKQTVIGSTLHIFGKEVSNKFIGIFDRLHDPNIYPGVQKFDCKYITSDDDITEKLEIIKNLFKNVLNDNLTQSDGA
jgi:hypothetical protein